MEVKREQFESHHDEQIFVGESSWSSSEGTSSSDSSPNFRKKLSALERTVLALQEKNAAQEQKLLSVTHELKELRELNSMSNHQVNEKGFTESETRIYVGNINPRTSLTELEHYFSKYGFIINAFFFREFTSCRNAFIDFADCASARRALSVKHFLNSRYLSTGKARQRQRPRNDNKENVIHNFKLKQNDSKFNIRYRPY